MHTVMPPARCSEPPPSSWRLRDLPHHVLQSRWTRLAVFSSSSPAAVERHRVRAAVQQPPAQLLLQQLDLAADRGLGDVEALRRRA